MMKNEWLVKSLTMGVIVLFVGTKFVISISGDIEKINKNQQLSIEIMNPRVGYVHFSGIPLFPTVLNLLSDTISFGGFRFRPIQVSGVDEGFEGDYLLVRLYINNEDKGLGTWNPETEYYEWQWIGQAYGIYNLNIIAIDPDGYTAHAYMSVWNLCFRGNL
jgi:hypothetical protein